MDQESRKNLEELIAAARATLDVLRRHAEMAEVARMESSAERQMMRRLNRALILAEYDLYGRDPTALPAYDWRQI